MTNKKLFILNAMIFSMALLFTACGSRDNSVAETQVDPSTVNNSEMFSGLDKEIGYDESTSVSIILSDDGCECSDNEHVEISCDETQTVTIKADGTYILSGKLSDGQIVVDAENAKLQLVLDEAEVFNENMPAFYVERADAVYVTLARDSSNVISSDGENAAFFSNSNVTFNGGGTLSVSAVNGNGIASKSNLKVTSGNYNIKSLNNGLVGTESVGIADGNLNISSDEDGIDSEGIVYICGGNICIEKPSK